MFGIKKERGIPNERFKEVSFDLHEFVTHHVIKDSETGVLYYMANSSRGVGLTPLLGANGKPIIEEVENN